MKARDRSVLVGGTSTRQDCAKIFVLKACFVLASHNAFFLSQCSEDGCMIRHTCSRQLPHMVGPESFGSRGFVEISRFLLVGGAEPAMMALVGVATS